MEDLKTQNKSKYALAKEIIENHYKPKQTADTVKEFVQTGDFEEDVKSLDQSGITDKMLEGALKELDHNKKTKNSVKKGGAFHEENCMIDIQSLFTGGTPNFHEVKYHLDWWYNIGLITNVIARRGIKMTKRCKMLLNALEERSQPNRANKSTYADWMLNFKADKRRQVSNGSK